MNICSRLEEFVNLKKDENLKIIESEYNEHNNLLLVYYDILNQGYRQRCGFKLFNIKDTENNDLSDIKDVTNKYAFYRGLFNLKFY